MQAPTLTQPNRQDVVTQLADKLAQLTPRAQISLLLRLGVPALSVMGAPRCTYHPRWRRLHDSESLAFDGTVLYCMECCQWVKQ